MHCRFMILKKFGSHGVGLPPARDTIYKCLWRSKIVFSETAWPMKAKFYMMHLYEGGTNVYINNPCHITKMATMPIYGKTLQKSLLWNLWTDFNKTWHVASGTSVLQWKYKLWPCDDLDLFYSKVSLGCVCSNLLKCHWREKLRGNGSMDRICMNMKIKLTPGVHLSLPWGCIHVYDHNSQTSLLVYTCIPDLRWAFTGPLVLWFDFEIHKSIKSCVA